MTTSVYLLTDILTKKRSPAANKNYMAIGFSVRTTNPLTFNKSCSTRQKCNPQSSIVYSSEHCMKSYNKAKLIRINSQIIEGNDSVIY